MSTKILLELPLDNVQVNDREMASKTGRDVELIKSSLPSGGFL